MYDTHVRQDPNFSPPLSFLSPHPHLLIISIPLRIDDRPLLCRRSPAASGSVFKCSRRRREGWGVEGGGWNRQLKLTLQELLQRSEV